MDQIACYVRVVRIGNSSFDVNACFSQDNPDRRRDLHYR